MYVVRSSELLEQRCLDLDENIIFASGSAKLLPGSEQRVMERIKQMTGTGLSIHKISVIGHADIQPIENKTLTNYDLARLRAERVKDVIIASLKINSDAISPYIKGTTEPKVQCPEKLSGSTLSECLAPNRRVEIRVELLQSTTPTKSP